MPKVTNVSGVLKVGKIAYGGYGYNSLNWNNPNNGKNSAFSSSALDALGIWTDSLVIHIRGVYALSSYPEFCKLYIDGNLSYIGRKAWREAGGCITYLPVPPDSYSAKAIFSKRNMGRIYKIKLEFYDEL